MENNAGMTSPQIHNVSEHLYFNSYTKVLQISVPLTENYTGPLFNYRPLILYHPYAPYLNRNLRISKKKKNVQNHWWRKLLTSATKKIESRILIYAS
jgi:hypothetical protein